MGSKQDTIRIGRGFSLITSQQDLIRMGYVHKKVKGRHVLTMGSEQDTIRLCYDYKKIKGLLVITFNGKQAKPYQNGFLY